MVPYLLHYVRNKLAFHRNLTSIINVNKSDNKQTSTNREQQSIVTNYLQNKLVPVMCEEVGAFVLYKL